MLLLAAGARFTPAPWLLKPSSNSCSQVLSKKLRSERSEEEREGVKIVAVDLQVQWEKCAAVLWMCDVV